MKENSEESSEREYKPMFNINELDLVISKEDLKFTDNTRKEKSKKINRNYDFLFSENESQRIDELVHKYYMQIGEKGSGIKNFATYLRLRFIEKVKHFYILEQEIWEDIHCLTSNIDKSKYIKMLEFMKTLPIVDEVKENNGVIYIKTSFGEIKFSTISNFFPNLEMDDNIENPQERVGNCHRKAIEYSKKLKAIGIDNDVVTANKHVITDKSEYLHSWNEFQVDEKEHVLDYTQNIVMNKEGYYSLNHINHIISRINCVNIENDEKIYEQISNGYEHIDYKTYLTCRDEIMRDLQKNIGIFEEER